MGSPSEANEDEPRNFRRASSAFALKARSDEAAMGEGESILRSPLHLRKGV